MKTTKELELELEQLQKESKLLPTEIAALKEKINVLNKELKEKSERLHNLTLGGSQLRYSYPSLIAVKKQEIEDSKLPILRTNINGIDVIVRITEKRIFYKEFGRVCEPSFIKKDNSDLAIKAVEVYEKWRSEK